LSSDDNDAAPYTDRLLNPYSQTSSGVMPFTLSTSSTYADAAEFAYIPTTPGTPFGAVRSPNDLDGLTDPRPAVLPSCYTATDLGSSYQYLFTPSLLDLTCPTDADPDSTADFTDPEARPFTDYEISVNRNVDPDEGSNGYTTFDSVNSYVVAGNCSSTGGSTDYGDCGPEMIADVFAHGRGGKAFDDGIYDLTAQEFRDPELWSTGDFVDAETRDPIYTWDDRDREGNPPSVWAVDVTNCYNDKCEEDETHPLTLNDQNEGDVEALSFYRAYLKFYAAADKNQLPLRTIIVDWGDNDQSGSDAPNNYYKNHRGLQEDGEISICETSETSAEYEWGKNAESCDPNYFSYNHIYTCNPTEVTTSCADNDGDGIFDNTPCTTDGQSCTFRPRVHVRDNWGWCTGTCDSTYTGNLDGTEGCYDSGDGFGNDDFVNECDYNQYPVGDPTRKTNPWVYYDGVITVTP
jgi:hypothetical protein